MKASEDDDYLTDEDEDENGEGETRSDNSDEYDEDEGNFMARCQSLSYNVEIGELHERDRFSWIENKTSGHHDLGTSFKNVKSSFTGGNAAEALSSLEEKKLKKLGFEFKMNHIK